MKTVSNFPPDTRIHPKTGIISVSLVITNFLIALVLYLTSFIPGIEAQVVSILSSVFLVFLLAVAPVFNLIGLILGIISARTKNSKKVLPIIGIIVHAAALMLTVAAWLLIGVFWYFLSHMVWR